MTSRARANQALYLARIVLGAWQRDIGRQEIPAATLSQAFEAGAREHLIAAYGWFLLEICQLQPVSDGPPRSCEELPAMPQGKVFPAEINEFRQLEAGGWLADLLQVSGSVTPVPRSYGNLAAASGSLADCEQLTAWLERLERLFERMGDSLDEC